MSWSCSDQATAVAMPLCQSSSAAGNSPTSGLILLIPSTIQETCSELNSPLLLLQRSVLSASQLISKNSACANAATAPGKSLEGVALGYISSQCAAQQHHDDVSMIDCWFPLQLLSIVFHSRGHGHLAINLVYALQLHA